MNEDMNFEAMLMEVSRQFARARVEQARQALPALLQKRLTFTTEPVTLDFALRFACAMYLMLIAMPIMGMMSGNLLDFVLIGMAAQPEKLSLNFLTRKIQDDFQEISPAIARSMTASVVEVAVLLCLIDWLEKDELPSRDIMLQDTHLYLSMALDAFGERADERQVLTESLAAFDALPLNERPAEMTDDVVAELRARLAELNRETSAAMQDAEQTVEAAFKNEPPAE